MRVVITGATGFLGRNLVLEILKNYKNNLQNLEIIFIGRSSESNTLRQRVKIMLRDEYFDYIDDKRLSFSVIASWLDKSAKFIDLDFSDPNSSISSKQLKFLQEHQADFFFHVAGATDFRDMEAVKKKLELINVGGAKKVLDVVGKIRPKEFSFVSTAYVCGVVSGNIMPDSGSLDNKFRNHYERTKLEAELMIREFCSQNNIKLKIFRPSIVGGRLYEKPIGKISKIDVFYAWCVFFYRYKQKILCKENCAADPMEVSLRFCCNKKAGLNIVPVDYVAKLMFLLSFKYTEGHEKAFHLVCETEIGHEEYTSIMLSKINVKGVNYVDAIPDSQNKFEEFYYKTLGRIYSPYTMGEPMVFNTDNIKLLDNINVSCPKITKEDFSSLIDYLKSKNFSI
jgi:nucleoside-diphosphate-sugar epimerase